MIRTMAFRNRAAGHCAAAMACCAGTSLLGCGSVPFLSIALDDNTEAAPACLDMWSPSHFASSVILGNQFDDEEGCLLVVGGAVAWEALIEPNAWPGWDESELNQVCDVILAMLGWLAGSP